jgi:hypothetical protein
VLEVGLLHEVAGVQSGQRRCILEAPFSAGHVAHRAAARVVLARAWTTTASFGGCSSETGPRHSSSRGPGPS